MDSLKDDDRLIDTQMDRQMNKQINEYEDR